MNQKRYIVQGKPHKTTQGGRRVTIMPGDAFVPTDAELKAFGDKFVVEIANVNKKPPDDVEALKSQHERVLKEKEDRIVELEERIAELEQTKEGQEPPALEGEEHNEELGVEQYHVGGGYYELPNGDKVRGKDNAIKALEE